MVQERLKMINGCICCLCFCRAFNAHFVITREYWNEVDNFTINTDFRKFDILQKLKPLMRAEVDNVSWYLSLLKKHSSHLPILSLAHTVPLLLQVDAVAAIHSHNVVRRIAMQILPELDPFQNTYYNTCAIVGSSGILMRHEKGAVRQEFASAWAC